MKPTLMALSLSLLPAAASAQAPATAEVELWRLDCGSIETPLNFFSDTMAYGDETMTLSSSCYLVRNGEDYLLWDTGLPQVAGDPPPEGQPGPVPGPAITEQLAEIGVTPEQIGRIVISHAHFDHVGQAAAFPEATLVIGADDWDLLQSDDPGFGVDPSLVQPWLDGTSEVEPVSGDLDLFGDGRVMLLAMPGHTNGETALLVRLAEFGPVILSGDTVHFARQLQTGSVPPFNASRADTLASLGRIEGILQNLGGRLVIGHEPGHIARLPAFPASAR